MLDFYHASQRLWAVAHTLHPGNDLVANAWVEPLLHQLRQGREDGVLQTLRDLPAWFARRAQPLLQASPQKPGILRTIATTLIMPRQQMKVQNGIGHGGGRR